MFNSCFRFRTIRNENAVFITSFLLKKISYGQKMFFNVFGLLLQVSEANEVPISSQIWVTSTKKNVNTFL